MARVRQDETIDELGVPAGQPLRIAAARPGMDSTTREPVPIRAYGCPEGKTPVSMKSSFGAMRTMVVPSEYLEAVIVTR